ncbi:A/G-specific adenine glycosylase [Candidatus Peregrinibacteria bacterium]|nr:MAG: A/G-specific adenine glycosylase [Candidatus Peregrinibacteria bacterium]
MKLTKAKTLAIQTHLIKWFQENHRDLPWRKTYDPYQVWISEVMLQQTQVTTVLPYFKRWMKALPTIESVAKAKEDKVLKLWEGLGYYSRARNIQKTAQIVLKEHSGTFPSDYNAILKLPGIGRYTAGAISSIAFNQERPIVDGNVIRVLARLFNFSKNTKEADSLRQLWEWAEELIPKGQAREFNQGMMELGALVCKPKNPKCNRCPLQTQCIGKQKGTLSFLPNKGERVEKIPIKVAIVVIRNKGKVFIQKRPHKGLMAGLWEFPGGKVKPGETPLQALHREVMEELGITIESPKLIKNIKHGYTKFKVDLHCYEANLGTGKLKLNSAIDGKWVNPEALSEYPFPVANVKLIEDL